MHTRTHTHVYRLPEQKQFEETSRSPAMPGTYMLGTIHNFQHFHKRTESTLFTYPTQKCTIKC